MEDLKKLATEIAHIQKQFDELLFEAQDNGFDESEDETLERQYLLGYLDGLTKAYTILEAK
jgi:hypothetical protein